MVASRNQQHGPIALHLDGDARAWVWTPNIDDPAMRLDIDILADLAVYAAAVIGRTAPEPDRDAGGITVFVDVDLGQHGSATLGGVRGHVKVLACGQEKSSRW